MQSALRTGFFGKPQCNSVHLSNTFQHKSVSFHYSTEVAVQTEEAKPKLTVRPYKPQLSRTKLIRDRVDEWMKNLAKTNEIEQQNKFLRDMYAKRLEWHRRIVEHEENRKNRIEERRRFAKKWAHMEKTLEEHKQARVQYREEMFRKKNEMYEKGKKEFLEALQDDENDWTDHPDELADKRYYLVREDRAYYTKYN